MARPCRYSTSKLLGSGAALASLGCVQTLGSLQFKNSFGAAVGVVGIAAGAALLLAAALLLLQGRKAPAHAAGGPQAAVLLPRWVARSLTGYGVWLLLLVLVRIASADVQLKGFPGSCPPTKQLGCSRVAQHNPHRTAGWDPVLLHTTLPAATSAVLDWIRQQPRTAILAVHEAPPSAGTAAAKGPPETVIHACFVSLLWGFADDVFVRLSLNAQGDAVLLEAQGQLRLGVGDMEVNVKRNAALMAAMKDKAAGGLSTKQRVLRI